MSLFFFFIPIRYGSFFFFFCLFFIDFMLLNLNLQRHEDNSPCFGTEIFTFWIFEVMDSQWVLSVPNDHFDKSDFQTQIWAAI